MLKLITKILVFFTLFTGLYASQGTSQKHLLSVSPEMSAMGVSPDVTIDIVFDAKIVAQSVKKNTIKLKNVKGTTTLVGDSTLRFTPSTALEAGVHNVTVKSVTLKDDKANTDITPKTGFQKFVYWVCSLFYADPRDCRWCQYVCNVGNDTVKTKKIKYNFTVDESEPKDVTAPIITLNGDANITIIQGTNYEELNATATDDRDGNVSVSISGNVDTATLGTYIMTYTATDTAGNSASIERTINIVLPPDTEAPVITLNGDANITLTLGESYEELGAAAHDQRDGDVKVTIEGSVDTSTEGTYTMTYTATDKAGNVVTATRTVTVVASTLTSLNLESNVTTLNVGEKAELTVLATYSDGSTSEIDANVEYIITPSDSADMNGTVLTAKKDANVTVQAKVNGVLSNTLSLTIAWVVNGHVLPPEPDKTLNDSTLLGIDTNNNNVRDDVERWIYETYKDKHPIHIDIAMQAARGYKLVLETPERAKEIYPEVEKSIYCEGYYKYEAEFFNEKNLIEKNIDNGHFRHKIYFNTKERMDTYRQYDTLLSGDSYTLPNGKEMKAMCDFNTSKY